MNTALTYAEVFRPSRAKSAAIYDITLIAGFSLLIGLSANIAFYLPLSPVPVTGQTMAVLMTGMLLGPRRGVLAICAYLGQGLAGMGVFSAGQAGPAVLFGPTGGYLVGFIGAAFVTGQLAQRRWDRSALTAAAAMVFGNAVLYTFGVIWLSVFLGPANALISGAAVFIPGDIVKIILAAILLPTGWKILNR